jgi:ribosomal protein L9
MKIILTKDIQLGKKGDTVSVSQPRGNYLIRMGVAKKHVAKVEVEQEEKEEKEEKPKPKKETKPKTKTKK